MYSRPREDYGISLPGDYCGTTFNEGETRRNEENDFRRSGERSEGAGEGGCPLHNERRRTGISSLLSELPLFSGLSSLGLSVPKFGAEDILIIATAAFLFFSKSGDKECAIMLLLLIFVAN